VDDAAECPVVGAAAGIGIDPAEPADRSRQRLVEYGRARGALRREGDGNERVQNVSYSNSWRSALPQRRSRP
jgi:hypothetical protein